MEPKKVMLSGIKPSGDLTLGSYLGAIRLWKESRALREGSLIRLDDMRGVLAYARFVREEAVIVLVNRLPRRTLYSGDIF